MLEVNSKVPIDISVLNDANEKISLRDFFGSYFVIYFYPKDNTPGCTTEACEFRDFNSDIKRLGVNILGISKDTVESHIKFKDEHKLNFELLSDPDARLIKAFGVLKEKSLFGKTFLGIQRSTFVINPNGKIIKVWEKVSPKGHAQEVYDFLMKEINSN